MKAFLSYKWASAQSNQWVENLARDLRRNGIDVLLDKWEVAYGESFTQYMTSRIEEASIFLFVITKAALIAVESNSGGGAVKFEVQLATAKRTAGEKFRFIGLLREGKRTPPHLRDYRYVDFRDDTKYRHNVTALSNDILGINDRPPLGAGAYGISGTQWEGIHDIHKLRLCFYPNGKLDWLWLVDGPGGGEIFPLPSEENQWEQHGNKVRCILNSWVYEGKIKHRGSVGSKSFVHGDTTLFLRNKKNWSEPFDITLDYQYPYRS